MSCSHCTGSHWLADVKDFGPCVCCTPESLTAAENAQVRLVQLTAAILGPTDYAEWNTDEQRETAAICRAEALADLPGHLADLMVSLGLDAAPLHIDNPHLRAIYEIVAPDTHGTWWR